MAGATMCPSHPRWMEFLERLDKVARCERTTESSRRILMTMNGIDVVRSLQILSELGGHCDCAILYDLGEMDASRRELANS
jgi:Protein of unknown function (DUF2695)